MIYKCTQCNYCTQRLCDLRRHENKKIPCDVQCRYGIVTSLQPSPQKHNDSPQKHNVTREGYKSIDVLNPVCAKCYKQFSRKDSLKRHEMSCRGLSKYQCKTCKKTFASLSSKANHTKYVKCVPLSDEKRIDDVKNVTTTNVINNTFVNNTNIQNNIHIHIDFGKETIQDLCSDEDYKERMFENIQCGKYALIRSIDDIYFNEKYPKNQTLKKERRNDKMVEILVNGIWEKRLFEDVFMPISTKIENYHTKFFKSLTENRECLLNRDIKYDVRRRPTPCSSRSTTDNGAL